MSSPASGHPLSRLPLDATSRDAPVPVSSKMSAKGANVMQPPKVSSAYMARGGRRPRTSRVCLARIEYMA
eukprot:scaffold15769_cov125-Isochrysis_galbana.AAC.5